MEESLINDISNIIKDKTPRMEIRNDYNGKKFLFKGKSGIEIGNQLDGLECIHSLMETVFYAKFSHYKEPLNFCGPSSYKTFIAQIFSIGAPVLNLYPETSIGQLLGSVSLVNNIEAKMFYLEEILKICGEDDKIIEFKNKIKKYYEEKNKEENKNKIKEDDEKKSKKKKKKKKKKDSDDSSSSDSEEENKKKSKKNTELKLSNKTKKILSDLKEDINKIISIRKSSLPECIQLSLDSLFEKLFDKESNNTGLFKDFTSIFKTGILLENILKQSSVILKNMPNLSTAVLERFNDLFNFMPKLSLNEDFCNTFTSKFKDAKEINNFSEKFRIYAISTLSGSLNLSDVAKSRLTTIYTSEYNEEEREIAAQSFEPDTPIEILRIFLKKYQTEFKVELSFLDIIKILQIFKKFCKIREEKNGINITFAIYFSLYFNFDSKSKTEKFEKILEEINPNFNEKLMITKKNNEENENPFEINSSENKLISKWTELEIKSVIENEEPDLDLAFISPFHNLLNYIHCSISIKTPLIIEGAIGSGKKTAINYIAKILGLTIIHFSISNTTTVEDLFCKIIPIQTETSIEFKTSRSKLLDAVDISKYDDEKINKSIIIIDNLQQASSNVLEALVPVFDTTKKVIFLPNGETVEKGEYNLISIFDPTSKGTNIKNAIPSAIKNSCLLYKCENYKSEKYLKEISEKMFQFSEDKGIKYQGKFIEDFIKISKYCEEN